MYAKFKLAKAKLAKLFLFPTASGTVNELTPYIDYYNLRGRTIDRYEF